MKKLMCVMMFAIFVSGCSSKKIIRDDENNADQGKSGIINESFDPLVLNEQELAVKKTSNSIEAKSDYDESFLTGIQDRDQDVEEVQGYRVQICAVSSEETARNIQRDAILKFNENIYLNFDSPYYKVRIGDCKTRYEAENLQKLAIQKGFNEAWVVKTKVKPQTKKESDTENIKN